MPVNTRAQNKRKAAVEEAENKRKRAEDAMLDVAVRVGADAAMESVLDEAVEDRARHPNEPENIFLTRMYLMESKNDPNLLDIGHGLYGKHDVDGNFILYEDKACTMPLNTKNFYGRMYF